jgi:hypothetical protein
MLFPITYQQEIALNTIKKYTFEPNTKVTWNKTYTGDDIINLRNRYGEGPFIIERVRDISDKCSCGLTEDESGHRPNCEPSVRQYFPHPQVVYLRTNCGSLEGFCAIFFQPAIKVEEEKKQIKKSKP